MHIPTPPDPPRLRMGWGLSVPDILPGGKSPPTCPHSRDGPATAAEKAI